MFNCKFIGLKVIKIHYFATQLKIVIENNFLYIEYS